MNNPRLLDKLAEHRDDVRRAFREFLTVPTLIIAAFALLAAASYAIDRARPEALEPLRNLLRAHVFADARATSDLLSATAAGLIAVTTLTITLLLIVVQQSASTMTAQVFDQFLWRRANQFYFGFFIGLTINTLLTLSTVTSALNPVFGGAFALSGTIVALYMLILLLYTTINQMRPEEIIEAIHDHILRARSLQIEELVERTRRASAFAGPVVIDASARRHGFVTRIDPAVFERELDQGHGDVEVRLRVHIGSFVAHGDVMAGIVAADRETAARFHDATLRAVHIERQRDLSHDPACGIEQLELIAWTSISTSKSNPGPGLRTIFSLRDIMARWTLEHAGPRANILPVVYEDDVFGRLFDAFETFAVVSSESMQHQIYIEVLRTFASLFGRLRAEHRRRIADAVRRVLPALGDHVLTAELDAALQDLSRELRQWNASEVAEQVEQARDGLARSVGRLASRSTRVHP
jgi:uncharacterized membrane protein